MPFQQISELQLSTDNRYSINDLKFAASHLVYKLVFHKNPVGFDSP